MRAEQPDDKPRPRRERVLDARSLRGLAHPMRVELLSLLRRHGPATATGLADRLGERSGTTSWHLRQLAEHGFIEEVPDRGTTRERWWRAAQDGTTLNASALAPGDAETKAAYEVYIHQVLDLYYRAAAATSPRRATGRDSGGRRRPCRTGTCR